MLIKELMLIKFLLFGVALCRGPHHPRGEGVARRHVHYKPTKGREQNIIQDTELIHDREHIQEHLEEILDPPNLDNLTDDELDFYYFQVHDVDKNNLLDGLEILQAIQHTTHHDHTEEDEEESDEENSLLANDLEYYTDLIDKVLIEDDQDNDGFLSYPEYKSGRDKETVKFNAAGTGAKLIN